MMVCFQIFFQRKSRISYNKVKSSSKYRFVQNFRSLTSQGKHFFTASCLYSYYILTTHFLSLCFYQYFACVYPVSAVTHLSFIPSRCFFPTEKGSYSTLRRLIYSKNSVHLQPVYTNKRLFSKKSRKQKMPRGIKKENLPSKVCLVCNRPFTWRKKWERCWDEVLTCSKSCNSARKLMKREKEKMENKEVEVENKNRKVETSCSTSFSSLPFVTKYEYHEIDQHDIENYDAGHNILDLKQLCLESPISGKSAENEYKTKLNESTTGPVEEILDVTDQLDIEGEGNKSKNIEEETNDSKIQCLSVKERDRDERKARKRMQKELKRKKKELGIVDASDETLNNFATVLEEKEQVKTLNENIEVGFIKDGSMKKCATNVGEKSCDVCNASVNLLIRCQIDSSKKWRMVCGSCWKKVSGGVPDGDSNHPHYRYGGLWKNKNKYRRR